MAISSDRGINSLKAAMYYHQPHLLVGLDGSRPAIRRMLIDSRINAFQLDTLFVSDTPEKVVESLRSIEIKDQFNNRFESDFLPVVAIPYLETCESDYAALIRLSQSAGRIIKEKVMPRNSTEQTLWDIFRHVLGNSEIGVEDNFFEVGGDSVLTIQVVSRANRAGLNLSPAQLFVNPTIAGLALVIGNETGVEAEQDVVIGELPQTPIQKWFFENDFAENDHWNMSVMLAAKQKINRDVLAQALHATVMQHDMLRAKFHFDGKRWNQTILGEAPTHSTVEINLSAVEEAQLADAIESAANEVQASLSLENGELVKLAQIDLGHDRGVRICFVVHHLVVDGVSWRIILEDIQSAIEQRIAGQVINLGRKTTSFKTWSNLLGDLVRTGRFDHQTVYWQHVLSQSIEHPKADNPNGENRVGNIAIASFSLTQRQTEQMLKESNRAYHTRINDLLVSGLMLALNRWQGISQTIIDMEGHGRETIVNNVDISRTVGWFTSLFPIVIQCKNEQTVGQLIVSTKEMLRKLPDRGVGYGVLRYLRDHSIVDLGDSPARISFNYLGQFDTVLGENSDFQIASESMGTPRSKKSKRSHELEISGMVLAGQLRINLVYSDQLYQAETINSFMSCYQQSLSEIVSHCVAQKEISYTPSDFPLAGLDQKSLTALVAKVKKVEAIYPLSPLQEGILFHCLLTPETSIYFEQYSCEFGPELDVELFEQAWGEVIQSHSMLRTSIHWENISHPLQVEHPTVDFSFERVDWQKEKGNVVEKTEEYLFSDRERGFDFEVAPLLKATIITLPDGNYRFVFSFSHLILDGWSLFFVFGEVFIVSWQKTFKPIYSITPILLSQ